MRGGAAQAGRTKAAIASWGRARCCSKGRSMPNHCCAACDRRGDVPTALLQANARGRCHSPYSAAGPESRPENTTSQSRNRFTSQSPTGMPAMCAGMGCTCFQRPVVAWAYVFPALAALAPSTEISKCGCAARRRMKRCPTVPVAPRMPTRFLLAEGCADMVCVGVRARRSGAANGAPSHSRAAALSGGLAAAARLG